MDRICQYSTIIFAGNVSVLLVVAIMTDYWEYRGFKSDAIVKKLPKVTNTTDLVFPKDTNSYVLLRYFWDARAKAVATPVFPGTKYQDQPPALLHNFFTFDDILYNVTSWDGTRNVTYVEEAVRVHRLEDIIILYVQYGNLFRECDSLEAGVRARLGLTQIRKSRCFNFITDVRPEHDFIRRELPAVIHIERLAFTSAVVCIIASVISLVGGAYGSLMHDKAAIITASSAALISGVSLTVTIALFHGKCHLIHRRVFMEGLDIPYKKIINDSRIHNYGWSFGLAWICVVLSFIHTWAWLNKAQDIGIKYSTRPLQKLQKRDRMYCSLHGDFSLLHT